MFDNSLGIRKQNIPEDYTDDLCIKNIKGIDFDPWISDAELELLLQDARFTSHLYSQVRCIIGGTIFDLIVPQQNLNTLLFKFERQFWQVNGVYVVKVGSYIGGFSREYKYMCNAILVGHNFDIGDIDTKNTIKNRIKRAREQHLMFPANYEEMERRVMNLWD